MKKITLSTAFFDDNQIRALQLQKGGDMALILYLKLLFGTSKDETGGQLVFLYDVVYDEKIIAGIYNIPVKTVKECLNLLLKFKLILKTNSCYVIADYAKIIGKHDRKKHNQGQRKYVERKKSKQTDDTQIAMSENMEAEG